MAVGRSVADVVGRRQVGGTPFAQLRSTAAALDRALRHIFMLADAAPVWVRRIGVGTVVARAAPRGCVKLARHTAAALRYAIEHKCRTSLGRDAIRTRRDIGWAGASRAVAVLRRVAGRAQSDARRTAYVGARPGFDVAQTCGVVTVAH